MNGNQATFTDAGGTTTETWNARNQLTSTSGLSLTASFRYDSFGCRIDKTINGTTTNFVYDGLNPVQGKNGGIVTANLLTGRGIDKFFTQTDGVRLRSLLPEVLGSTIVLGSLRRLGEQICHDGLPRPTIEWTLTGPAYLVRR